MAIYAPAVVQGAKRDNECIAIMDRSQTKIEVTNYPIYDSVIISTE